MAAVIARHASVPSRGAASPAGAVAKLRTRTGVTIAFFLAHVPLAMLMRTSHAIATAHAIACLAVGIMVAATSRRIQSVALVLAYIAGSEVLWRMNHASVFWEFGKYAAIAVLVVSLLRIRARKNRRLALAYFGLLLPSVALTFVTLGLDLARQEVSFCLSGPLALTLAVLYFSNVRFDARQRLSTLLAFTAPVVGIAALTIVSTLSHKNLSFGNAANFATSAGFGPNQVAAELGLAAMFALLIVMDRAFPWRFRLSLFAIAIVTATMSALTFARGGLILALAGLFGASFYLLRGNPRARATIVIVGILSLVVGKYIIAPRLDRFTGGELSDRYSNIEPDGRDQYIASELEFFAEHPVMGVGPGVGTVLRAQRDLHEGASHTEYTRLLAEHGLFGVGALVCLVLLGMRAIRSARDPRARAYAVAMAIWTALFLLVYSTRLFAPFFVFGLAFAVSVVPPKPARPAVAPVPS